MPISDTSPEQRALHRAFAVSLVIHLLLLFAVHTAPPSSPAGALRLEASLAPPAQPTASETSAAPPEKKAATPAKNSKNTPRPRVLSTNKPGNTATPTWTAAQKAEMDSFLNEIDQQARAAPKPTLAQRSLAMAREQARQLAAQDEAGEAMLERRPNGPPADPFSLEMYMDGLVRRLNRSAAYVRNDPRSKGIRPASVQFRLNPDGSLKSFVVLNAGDQADEIAYIKSVIERSVPFSPFPPDIDKAARSLGVTICIQPGSSDSSGLGFSRMHGGRCR
ncbi:hypothetical protein GBK02_10800 [Dechloromonas sp. TW-R-39-2]|nr:hypothetical protein GBK02_10800 [Dechloromonas sp. TW-R-39-2]